MTRHLNTGVLGPMAVAVCLGMTLGWATVPVVQDVPVPPPEEFILPAPVRAPEPVLRTDAVTATVTAYCPCSKCCGVYADGVTSTGRSASTRGAAVDPKLIPYGTTIDVPGFGTVVADDTGGAMRRAGARGEYHIDLRFPTHAAALEWGRKTTKVTIHR